MIVIPAPKFAKPQYRRATRSKAARRAGPPCKQAEQLAEQAFAHAPDAIMADGTEVQYKTTH